MNSRKKLACASALVLAAMLPLAAPLHAQDFQGSGSEEAEADGAPRSGRSVRVDPYIEANTIANWQISPESDVLTYTQLAAGVDTSIQGRNNGLAASVRYERNFAHQSDGADSDSLSGIVRGYASVVPNVLTVEAGALANRTSVDGSGRSTIAPFAADDLTTQTYSVYAGPTLQTQAGPVEVSANYRIGYTRVEAPEIVTASGQAVDIFDDSVSHSANVRAGIAPGWAGLPVGVGVGAGYYQEDVSNLDQRVRDAYVRGDVTVPVSPTLAFVFGAGFEDVEVSSRDAVRDADGNPVIGSDGRYVTDETSPRVIAYEADGLIWDVGVMWRPSSRTQLQATFGHRYDSETFYGSFTWTPSSRSTFGIGVYDGIQGFGGRLNNALAALPTDFSVVRDPVTGDITGCVNSFDGSGCIDGVLGSVRSSVFRGRGVALSYTHQMGRTVAGIGAGYDRRRFIGAPGTPLALADGIVDESVYVSANLAGPLGRGNYSLNTYANWFESGAGALGDAFALGTSASYSEQVWRNLSARAAVALSMLDAEAAPDEVVTASALLGLRYDF
ncbi:preprotein translocase subunit YajC [Qipengyuania sp. 6B39]|uniref:preprotein translocase subunit YajC n=1 Tax=Qipengyuania proteolytica TaxID=2867239 RepID=UPI001C8A9F2A|nr:preprotein translocase subunit YajC [Qipengyuania proteolytica]MBX7496219.1 preprotein translocase subunit YajC [Qipengyuania proteolytica]